MLKTVVSGNNTPFTGKSFTAYHPVSQNWRDSYAKTPVSSTKPSRVQFEIPSTSPKWVFVVRALVTVKGTGAAKDELNKM
jgi:hypothetical protein